MVQISGARDTANINQDRRVVDMAKEIALLEPNAAPLTVLLKQIKGKSKVTKNPLYKNLTDELPNKWDAVNDGTDMSDSDTAMVVDDGTKFSVNDVIEVPATGEQLLVTAISTNSLTVTRGWGTTSAAIILDDAVVHIIANASSEGASAPTPNTAKTVTGTNYTQIMRTPFSVTGTQDASELYGGDDMVYLAKKYGIAHKKNIEEAMLFGEKKEDTTGTHPKRFTGGFNSLVTTNVTDASGALTETEFETFLRSVFRYGSSKKTLMASPLLISAINSWAAGKLQTVSTDKTYGIDVTKYLSGHGTLNIVKHNLLEESYSGVGFCVDMDSVGYRFLAGRDTQLKTNRQDNSSDTRMDEYLTECGFYMTQEKQNGKLVGVTSYT